MEERISDLEIGVANAMLEFMNKSRPEFAAEYKIKESEIHVPSLSMDKGIDYFPSNSMITSATMKYSSAHQLYTLKVSVGTENGTQAIIVNESEFDKDKKEMRETDQFFNYLRTSRPIFAKFVRKSGEEKAETKLE